MRLVAIRLSSLVLSLALFAVPAFAADSGSGSVSLTASGVPFSQNFDSLASSGSSNILPTGWYLNETGTGATVNGSYTAGNGSSATGDAYSFGSGADRAFGALRSGSNVSIIGAQFTNNTGVTITSLGITYTGEEWREGVTNRGTADRMDFQYSLNATAVNAGTFVDFNSLDFNTPNVTAAAGPVDGNATGNRTTLSATITGLSIAPGASFWIRWTDFDISSSDDGLAVDDFQIVANPGLPSTNPTGTGSANPSNVAPGATTLLTVLVTPGTNPASTGIAVSADLSSIGGSVVTFHDDGSNSFSFTATVDPSTTGGSKSIPVTITDAQTRSGTTSIALTVVAPTPPTGTGSANPNSVSIGGTSLLTVTVTPGTNPASTGITVTGDLSSILGSPTESFSTTDNITFTFSATVPLSNSLLGPKTFPVTIKDAQNRTSSTSIALTVSAPTVAPGTVVISQVYGGGGNSGATLKNDFIELFNRSNSPVLLDGWSVQFSGSTNTFVGATPLTGVIQPHGYYLIQESQGAGGSVNLPTPDLIASGSNVLFLGATAGRVALVTTAQLLSGSCPTGAQIIDFVGYGNSSCAEGASVGVVTNTTAVLRKLGGCTDTNNNSLDFFVAQPMPRNSASPVNDCNVIVPPSPHAVISQIYAGGGNSGAVYTNDFVELFNPTGSPVNLNDWSIQYAPAAGNSWNSQPIGGTLAPGEYYLIQLASGNAPNGGVPLPPPRVIGSINMASTTGGKVALVKRVEALTVNCPVGDPALVDLLGYGTADCFEGGLPATAAGNNAQAIFRKDDGNTDTDQNSADFFVAAPVPRGSGPLVDLVPRITSVDPPDTTHATFGAPFDASVTIDFSESVTVSGSWFSIACTMTGLHGDVEVNSAFTRKTYILTPNVGFTPGESCTVHVNHTMVTDEDGTTDSLPADVVWTFNVASGTPVETADVHLTMGNPSAATMADANNFLMSKPEFALSYNRDKGTPNWVSWHLTNEWAPSTGGVDRTDVFRPDPAISRTWYRVLQTDYSSSGFDRGHMCPSADRVASVPINEATFLMNNMVPQAHDNNAGPWEGLESYLRTLLPANEIYIVSGPLGVGGIGTNGPCPPTCTVTTTLANGHVTVPASTWKVALVLPKLDGNDVTRVNAATRTIAVNMPNTVGIAGNDWHTYLTTVRAIEQLTGYNFFSNVPRIVQNSIELGTDGTNPPGVADESVNTDEDQPASVTLNAVSPDPAATFTYTLDSTTSHGTLSGSGAAYSYTPAPDYNGTDTFTFHVTDGHANSTTATVTIHIGPVNDAPVPQNDSVQVEAGQTLTVPAANLTSNDSAGPADESSQSLTVTSVSATSSTHGTVTLASGAVSYTPDALYVGAASFTDQVCDNGTPAQCASATVNVTVTDTSAPSISPLTLSTNLLWPPNHKMIDVTVDYTAADNGDSAPACSLNVSSNEPADGTGDGDQAPDWQIVDNHHVRLRAERVATGTGRVYTVGADCVDRFGNLAHSAPAFVNVPRNQ
jgi:DNA/RNA endonuclease G (NUC1)